MFTVGLCGFRVHTDCCSNAVGYAIPRAYTEKWRWFVYVAYLLYIACGENLRSKVVWLWTGHVVVK
jgi:hypothetical protein